MITVAEGRRLSAGRVLTEEHPKVTHCGAVLGDQCPKNVSGQRAEGPRKPIRYDWEVGHFKNVEEMNEVGRCLSGKHCCDRNFAVMTMKKRFSR